MKEQLLRLRRLADVPRWAVIPTLRKQSVAEHSFHVVTLCTYIGPMHRAVATEEVSMGRVLQAALTHDEIEAITGDEPAPVKVHTDGVGMEILANQLGINPYKNSTAIKQIVKMADIAEAVIFLREEMAMGNQTVERVYNGLLKHFTARWIDFDYRPRRVTEAQLQSGAAWKPSWHKMLADLSDIYEPRLHPALDHI